MCEKIEDICQNIFACLDSSLNVFLGREITVQTIGHNLIYITDQDMILTGKSSITMKIRGPSDASIHLWPTNYTGSDQYEVLIGKGIILSIAFLPQPQTHRLKRED